MEQQQPREFVHVTLNLSQQNSTFAPNLSDVWDDFDLVVHDFHKDKLTVYNVQNLVLIILYVITFIVATSANSIALIVFWRFQHMRCLSNSLLITLAVSDLLVSIVCMPMSIGQYAYKLWVFGEGMCKFTHYLQGVAVAASVFTMTVMSLDRYMVICHPIAFRKHLYRRHVGWSILSVWLLSLLLFVPVLIVRKAKGIILHPGSSREMSFVYCVEDWSSDSSREGFAFATFTLVFVLPGATMAAAYCRIGVRLCGGGSGLNRSEGRSTGKQVSAGDVYSHLEAFQPFGLLLGHINSAINPLLYCWVNKRFRKCVALTFRCTKTRDAVWDRRDIFQCQEYPMTMAASLRSSSLTWKKSFRKTDSSEKSRRNNTPTSATLDSGVSIIRD
ncbi:QRFP-like peptide receptor isoform X2 [Parasteatoda tepidariorum]|uniref:QRFP-like peptide receptor isoform X2 n=1 Tax=Parasteatoda tepidariorum TaxID=114398 RepID=UPI001C71D1A8|nr:QRFP-like peptide receptor isoform X2 [Parasteatoda tepidariorum]